MSYDLGAIYFEDIPAAVPFMEILELAESNEVLIRWVNPSITVHGNPLNNISSIKIFKNEELLAEITNRLADNADVKQPDRACRGGEAQVHPGPRSPWAYNYADLLWRSLASRFAAASSGMAGSS